MLNDLLAYAVEIQQTALLFLVASWALVSTLKADDVPTYLQVTVLLIFALSGVIGVGLTLYRIWA